MPPRPLLKQPPRAPDVPLPRSKAPGWFELAAQTLGGALGVPPLSAEDYDSPEGGRSIDRAGTLGELLSMGGVGTMLGMAMKGAKAAKGTLGAAMGKRIPTPIKAYHGSPHDFDQFSLDKIGTGEGAQAYGHGLYFAENPGTAEQYKKDLGKVVQAFDGVPVTTPSEMMAHDILSRIPRGPDEQATLRRAVQTVDEWADAGVFKGQNEGKAALDVKRAIEANFGKKLDKAVQGKTYEVNIHATPDELLDWDKPLSQQPDKVREALTPLVQKAIKREMVVGFGDDVTAVSGGDAYGAAVSLRKPPKDPLIRTDTAAATEALRKQGIKGIQYLDQGSRASGAGTRNFVIFDDELIEIAKKYGIPIATAASLVEQQGGTVQPRQ